MQVLLIYATIEGHSAKISRHVRTTLEAEGHKVLMLDATESPAMPHVGDFDAVITAAPVHAGTFPAGLRRFMKANATTLMARPGAFVTVSLSAASDDPAEIDDISDMVEAFSSETGWWPVSVHHAAGALKYTEYDYFRRWMLRRIIEKDGGPTDTSRDYEFTDWSALDEFAIDFARQAPNVAGKI